MAVLTAEEKRIVAQKFVRRAYKTLDKTADLTADDVLAAIQPTEDWIINNQASYNTDLPTTFKNTATLQEKTLLFCYVAMKQAGLI